MTLSQISALYWPTGSMPTDPEELDQNRWGPTNYPGSFTREEIVHYYAQKTGCDASQIAFYLTFARFKLAVIVQQIYYRYHQGLTKDERFAAHARENPNTLACFFALRANWPNLARRSDEAFEIFNRMRA